MNDGQNLNNSFNKNLQYFDEEEQKEKVKKNSLYNNRN